MIQGFPRVLFEKKRTVPNSYTMSEGEDHGFLLLQTGAYLLLQTGYKLKLMGK